VAYGFLLVGYILGYHSFNYYSRRVVLSPPIHSKLVMRVLTFCVLAVTLCTFVYLAYESSLVTVLVTVIKTAALTGKHGW